MLYRVIQSYTELYSTPCNNIDLNRMKVASFPGLSHLYFGSLVDHKVRFISLLHTFILVCYKPSKSGGREGLGRRLE